MATYRHPGADQPAPSDRTGHPPVHSAYDEPVSGEEMSRMKFMATATLAIGGLVTLGLGIPIVGSLLPPQGGGGASWTALDPKGWSDLQSATDKAVQITINLRGKDAYLPEQSESESVWGIKIKDISKFKTARPDLFTNGKDTLPYPVVNLGFVLFSPICPHLGCHYQYNADANKFQCPCHGSQFDNEGAHIAGPADRGLDPLPLREQSGKAEVEWIRYQPTIPDRIVVSYTS